MRPIAKLTWEAQEDRRIVGTRLGQQLTRSTSQPDSRKRAAPHGEAMSGDPQDPLDRPVVAVANAKGGVGKTSIVANIAGLAARNGWQVLAIDLDPQGNLATDLGYQDRTDLGKSLSRTLRDGREPTTMHAVRPGLDVWAGGPALAAAVPSALIPQVDNPLTEAIRSTGTTYEMVFIDCPPALGPLVDAGLGSATHLLVPIRADHASLAGLDLITERFHHVRAVNPRLELLGVTLFDVSRAATAIAREVAQAIRRSFKDAEPRLLPAIRRSERSAFDMRREGLLAHEHGRDHTDDAASKLARDYDELARAVFDLILPDLDASNHPSAGPFR